MHYFKVLLILTASAAVLGWGKSGALATASNISETEPCLQFHSLQIAEKSDRNLTNLKDTLKKGSAISIDPDRVRGIPKAEARTRFILNKIYRVQEGTTADDLFIVDEKANKWAVEDVSEATEGSTTHIKSGSIGIILPTIRTRQCRFPTPIHCRETALPCLAFI